ncbi:choice-of-anchor B family protein [Jejudonia soesokkakensis]|uniref:Choice-of-anchor B family protein n=1 Tax=Jejudonia soesokkakensis TaxID=1323432 RepID=A0ABW2MUW8_9FLAO
MKKILLTPLFILFTTFISEAQTPCTRPEIGQGSGGVGTAAGYDCRGIDLLSFVSYNSMGAAVVSGFQGNDSWGWTDVRDGKEYALVGLTNGLYFLDISDPINPRALGRLPKPSGISNSLWSDVKIYENWAFIVSESSNFGMQVFDLNHLQSLTTNSNRVFNLTTEANANRYARMTTIPGTSSSIGDSHNIIINEDSGIAYILGANIGAGGPILIGIDTSTSPPTLSFKGNYSTGGYTHDAQVVIYDGPDPDYQGREIFIGSNEDEIIVIDFTDEINNNGAGTIDVISTLSYPNFDYTHQGWFTKDKKYFILGDEHDEAFSGVGNTKTIVFNLEDLDNPVVQFNYQGRTPAIDHNGYVKDNRFYMANYTAGITIKRIHSIDDPITPGSTIQENGSGINGNMVEESYFDTYTTDNGNTFNGGAWNLYPYFESGSLLVTNLDGGVFILKQQNYDNEPPVVNCTDYTATLNKATGSVTITADDLAVGATDNKGITKKTITSGQTTFTCADVGNTFNVTIEVEDDYGLKASCTRVITVEAEETQYTGGDISNDASWTNGFPSLGSEARITNDATLTTATSIDACTCTVDNARTLTVNANAYLKTEKDITINGNLIVEHEGSIVQTDPSAQVIKGASGVINVKNTTPFLKPRDFMIMGSPMTAETRDGVYTDAFLVLEFNPGNFEPAPDLSAQGTNFADADGDYFSIYENGPINPTEGFIVRPQASYTDGNQTYDMTHSLGTLNSGTITRPIAFNTPPINNPDGTPNVVSNPYASAISATAFLTENPSIEAIYFWEHITPPNFSIPGNVGLRFDMDDVSIYNSTGGLKAASDTTLPTDPNHTKPNDLISTSQGFSFFADGSATEVSFTNAMRITGENNTLTRPIGVNRIWLDLRESRYGIGSSTLLAFNPIGTEGIDYGYDTNRLATIVSLYTLTEDEQHRLSIQTTTEFNESREIKLGFSSQVEETLEFTISMDEFDGLELEDATIYLIDTYNNVTINLSENESYTFQSSKTTLDDRFLLRFVPSQILSTENPLKNEIIVYPNPSKNFITIHSPNGYLEKIEVFDVRGRRMAQDIEEEQNSYSMDISLLETSIYFVKIVSEAGTVTKKIIKE